MGPDLQAVSYIRRGHCFECNTDRLAVIVSAEVAGYSRLVAADEEGTLASLRAHRTEPIDPKISEHGGHIASTAGDSLLIEFPSVLAAVLCAVEKQRGINERNVEVPAEQRITFRVGINLGDVTEQDGDLLGDGVNVATRLQELANPGRICISDHVYIDVHAKVDAGFENLGATKFPGIGKHP